MLLSKKGRVYKEMVAQHCQIMGYNDTNLAGGLIVSILLRFPDKRRRDIDNYAKAVLDALTDAGVWLDDSQINALSIVRGAIAKPGECVISIAPEDCRTGEVAQSQIDTAKD